VTELAGTRPAQVVYLGGLGRSGSTLIERLLGELPGVCPAGEVVHLWRRGLLDGERCGCGTPLPDCRFWQQVAEAAFGGWDRIDAARVGQLHRQVSRTRLLPLLASPVLPPGFRAALDEYLSYYERLYHGIREVSGGRVVVDSSKLVSLAFCLRWSARLDLRVVQVVRDSRAVAYSWGKRVSRPDSVAHSVMARHSPASAAARWDLQNGALHLLATLGTPALRVRYEDFTAAPETVLRQIAGFAGVPAVGHLGFVGGQPGTRWVELTPAHTASGNPMRFQTGPIALRRDDAWRGGLPAGQRRLVTALTFPLLARYGYLRDGGAGAAHEREVRPAAAGYPGGRGLCPSPGG
jgi:Sulfotransferase family